MRVAASIFLCSLGVLLVSCSANSLPAIRNPDLLRKDCIALHDQFPVDQSRFASNAGLRSFYEKGFTGREVPKEKWPQSVAALEPLGVASGKFGVVICIIDRRVKGQKGYFVPVNTNSLPRPAMHGMGPFDLTPSRYEGIWEFFQPSSQL